MDDVDAALRALTVADQRVEAARRELSEAEHVFQDCLQAYVKARPLTLTEHDAIVRRVEDGGAICCDEGIKWLRDTVPEVWAVAINAWAYANTGCNNESAELRSHWASKVRALKLDRLPGSES